MTKLIHSSPLGALEIPGLGVIEPGEPFEVDAVRAAGLLEQAELYSVAPKPRSTRPKKTPVTAKDADTTKGASE